MAYYILDESVLYNVFVAVLESSFLPVTTMQAFIVAKSFAEAEQLAGTGIKGYNLVSLEQVIAPLILPDVSLETLFEHEW
jgi:hypothetical protein